MDPFAVIGLHADDTQLSIKGVRHRIRHQVIPHIFERGEQGAPIRNPRVPLWRHVNRVKDLLLGRSKARFNSLRAEWAPKSTQVWNPFAEKGTVEAMSARHSC